MNDLRHKKIDWVGVMLAAFAVGASFLIYYFRAKISSYVASNALFDISNGLFYGLLVTFISIVFFLYRMLTAEANKIDDVIQSLTSVPDKPKQHIRCGLGEARSIADSSSKKLIIYLLVSAVLGFLLFIFNANKLPIFLITLVVLTWNSVTQFRFYYQLKNTVRNLREAAGVVIVQHARRAELLDQIHEDSKSQPIQESDHLKGYTSMHH